MTSSYCNGDEKMYTTADRENALLIHADMVEDTAYQQIQEIVKHPAFKELIAIMPDVHAGAGCVIGFTGKFRNAVIPNIVGVDIGCGVLTYPIGKVDVDFEAFDEHARERVPLGFRSRGKAHPYFESHADVQIRMELIEDEFYQHYGVKMSKQPELQIGTLGGGNHFIEIDEAPDGEKFITIHSGSRNFGLKVANYFQSKAKKLMEEMSLEVPAGLEYLPMSFGGEEYMRWLHIAQDYALLNRAIMMTELLEFFELPYMHSRSTLSVHNYISKRDHIIRKGAISAHKDETVVIPLNMAEGIIIGKGKSNRKYNFSAPHGAGRAFGRKEMMRRLERGEVSMNDFEDSMTDVFSTSVSEKTIDESPFAYKPTEQVLKHIEETVEITARLKPVYNLKADD